jgi:hypothetical protein
MSSSFRFCRFHNTVRNHRVLGRYAFYASALRRGDVGVRVKCALVRHAPHDQPRVLPAIGAPADERDDPRVGETKGAGPHPAAVLLLVDARQQLRPVVAFRVVELLALLGALEPRARLRHAIDLARVLEPLCWRHASELAPMTSEAGDRLEHAALSDLHFAGGFALHAR